MIIAVYNYLVNLSKIPNLINIKEMQVLLRIQIRV
jgi:hypothetical protein